LAPAARTLARSFPSPAMAGRSRSLSSSQHQGLPTFPITKISHRSDGIANHRQSLERVDTSRLLIGGGHGGHASVHRDGLRGKLCTPTGQASSSHLRPDVVFARTHTGCLSIRPSSSATSFTSAPSDTTRRRGHGGLVGSGNGNSFSDVSSAAGNLSERRFYATAPAGRIGSAAVEEATGVRLSDGQLSVLRRRYQGGNGGFSGADHPSSADLRREVFGSLVLRPGQWPKRIPEDRLQTPSSCSRMGYSSGRYTPQRHQAGHLTEHSPQRRLQQAR